MESSGDKFQHWDASIGQEFNSNREKVFPRAESIPNDVSGMDQEQFVFCQESLRPDSLTMMKPIGRLRNYYQKMVYIWIIGQDQSFSSQRLCGPADSYQELVVHKQNWLEQTLIRIQMVGSLPDAVKQIEQQFSEMNKQHRIRSDKIEGIIFSDLKLATQIIEYSEICKFLAQIIYFPIHDDTQQVNQFQKWKDEQKGSSKFLCATLSQLRLHLKLKNAFPNFGSLSNQTVQDKSLRTILNTIINCEMRGEAQIQIFLELARRIYPTKSQEAILEVEKMYKEKMGGAPCYESIIKMYTTPCFFHELLNRMIRVSRAASELFCCQKLIHDLHKGIMQIYQRQLRENPKQGQFWCTRGALYSVEELNKFESNVGKYISTFGFLSSSLNPQIGKSFATNAIMRIRVRSRGRNDKFDHGYIFAKDWSRCPEEEEVIFNILNAFYVLGVSKDESGITIIQLQYGVQTPAKGQIQTFLQYQASLVYPHSQLQLYLSLQQSEESLIYFSEFLKRNQLWEQKIQQNHELQSADLEQQLVYEIHLAQIKTKYTLSLPKQLWNKEVPSMFQILVNKVQASQKGTEHRRVHISIVLLSWCQFIYESIEDENEDMKQYLSKLQENSLQSFFAECSQLENMISCVYCYFKIKLLYRNQREGMEQIKNIIEKQLHIPHFDSSHRLPFQVYNNQFGIPKQMYLEIKGELFCNEGTLKESRAIFHQAKQLDQQLNGRRTEMASSMVELVKELNFLNPYFRGSYQYCKSNLRYLKQELSQAKQKFGEVSIQFINWLIEVSVQRIQSGFIDEGLKYIVRCRKLFSDYIKMTREPRFKDCQINRALRYENDYREYKKMVMKYFMIYVDLLLLDKYQIILKNIGLIEQNVLSHCGMDNQLHLLLLSFKAIATKYWEKQKPSINDFGENSLFYGSSVISRGNKQEYRELNPQQNWQKNQLDEYLSEIRKGKYFDQDEGNLSIDTELNIRKFVQSSPEQTLKFLQQFESKKDAQNFEQEYQSVPLYCLELEVGSQKYLFLTQKIESISYFEDIHFSEYLKMHEELELKIKVSKNKTELAGYYALLADFKTKIGEYESSYKTFNTAIEVIGDSTAKNKLFFAQIWTTSSNDVRVLQQNRRKSNFMIFL